MKITATRRRVLTLLERDGPLNGMGFSRTLDECVRGGLAERIGDDPRSSFLYRITDAGRSALGGRSAELDAAFRILLPESE